MKPKTELHSIVNRLANTLKRPTKKQLSWAYDKIFSHYVHITKQKVVCLSCGEEIHGLDSHKNIKCPVCNNRLKSLEGRERTLKDADYFSIWEIVEGYQVLRYFYVKRYLKSGLAVCHDTCEVFQHWISPDGKHTIRAVGVNAFSYGYFDGWQFGTALEIRNDHDRYFLWDVKVCPGKKLLKNIKRNGFQGDYRKYHPAALFSFLLRNPIAETFFKANKMDMFHLVFKDERRFTKYWHSYKICMRHKFKIKDYSTWLDHMELLTYFKYDTHNPIYLNPESKSFIKEHNRLYQKKCKIDDLKYQEKLKRDKIRTEREAAEKEERDRKELEKSLKIKQKYVNMVFRCKDLYIVVLTDLDEFKKEGEILKHCVYRNEYYKKSESLILSARKGEKRLETIELDLHNMKVIQSRGYDNKPSEYHNQILSLMNRNIKKLQQVA